MTFSSVPASAYANLYMVLTEVARECGYALAMHGSSQRDFDLIAVPWIEGAIGPERLVYRIRVACSGWVNNLPEAKKNPKKSHMADWHGRYI